MASLSASPSGRRLSELLEEKQEPFYLDLHLLEKGCSPRLLDGYDTAAAAAVMCWPAAAAAGGGNDAAASVLRRLTTTTTKKKKEAAARGAGKKTTKKPAAAAAAATGLLRVLLSKILHVKAASNRKPAALQSSESFSFKKVAAAAAAPSPCSTKHHPLDAAAAADEKEEEIEYTDSESDDEKQFSPVSVLDHPFDFESSPIHKRSPSRVAQPQGSPKNAMAFVRDLLEAAYSPALLTHLLSKTDDLINATADAAAAAASDDDDDDDCCYHHESDGGELAPAAAYWEAQRAELTRVSAMVASEVPSSSRIGAADVRPERDGVGADLEAAVLDQLLHELAVELAGGR
ncbi:uncharacterized protein [Oryza sativa Japonica Group]|uniref:Expressed protein n=2 Tax=Oryza sativa subsp. japonica TaxID=39947 RepID=Q2R2P8_ORYSJ|nr:expressed protein [Oryza sativa Japonica Group]KAB8115555.1 hypothetical protein EE612_056112 [Oryza sativa]KAF2911278.1 hypothetical protein DAI22_11g164700 [Oryza sativa Japonica Group]BAH95331.1 Os11g0552500 [Oryza sativa Japonica Group]BAT14434.1 Os11g0552500 [Oryza sativa Japonica Group]|eukprot:NP_001176603.1 Os11g0552500 [Oryza sativa Japonica Group]